MTFISLKQLERGGSATAGPNETSAGDGATLELGIRGMHCAACVTRVEEALGSVAGVAQATVNLATERAHVRLAEPVAIERLEQAVHRAGYEARLVTGEAFADEERRERERELAGVRRRFVVAAVLGAPVVLLGMAGMVAPLDRIPMRVQSWIQLALATPVQWWAGWRFVRGTWRGVKNRAADMDLLIGVGSLSAYLYSLVATVAPGRFRAAGAAPDVFFDTSVAIVACLRTAGILSMGTTVRRPPLTLSISNIS